MSRFDKMRDMGKIEQCLKEPGYVIMQTKGTSMWPLFTEGKSRVEIVPCEGKALRKGDIVLYRKNDDTLVLHRILKAADEESFLVCGDHQWREIERIGKDEILGVAQGFYIKGSFVDDETLWYRVYKKIWNGNLTIRRCCLAFLRLSGIEKRCLK